LRLENHGRFDGVLELERIEVGMLGLSIIIPYRDTMWVPWNKGPRGYYEEKSLGSCRDVSLGTTNNKAVGCCREESTSVVKEGLQVKHNSFIEELWICVCGHKGEEVMGFCKERVHGFYGERPISTSERSLQA